LKEPVVKKSLLVAAFVLTTLGVTSLASAQAQPDRGVAVVDLKYIFDNFPWFKAQKDQVDGEIKAAEAEVAAEKKNVEQLKDERDKCKKGTADYQARDTQFTRAQIELGAKVQNTRKRFVEREANLYLNAYKTIVAQVEEYAKHMGYSMVLRYNKDLLTDEMEGDPRKVAVQLNKPVVWIRANNPQNIYDPNNRDITIGVLEVLKQRYGAGANHQPHSVPRPKNR
jgi:Skp family chaperone for outer membrane proteins